MYKKVSARLQAAARQQPRPSTKTEKEKLHDGARNDERAARARAPYFGAILLASQSADKRAIRLPVWLDLELAEFGGAAQWIAGNEYHQLRLRRLYVPLVQEASRTREPVMSGPAWLRLEVGSFGASRWLARFDPSFGEVLGTAKPEPPRSRRMKQADLFFANAFGTAAEHATETPKRTAPAVGPQPPRKRPAPDKRKPASQKRKRRSVFTVSGGAFDSNRRRH